MSHDVEVLGEIVIAALRGEHWVVVGDAHLPSRLDPDDDREFDVSFIECENWVQVLALWQRESEDDGAIRTPWSIHPSVARNLRRKYLIDDDDEGWNLNLK